MNKNIPSFRKLLPPQLSNYSFFAQLIITPLVQTEFKSNHLSRSFKPIKFQLQKPLQRVVAKVDIKIFKRGCPLVAELLAISQRFDIKPWQHPLAEAITLIARTTPNQCTPNLPHPPPNTLKQVA